MPVNSTHPEYDKRAEDWRRVRDCIEGDSALRRDITFYLPVPPGLDGAPIALLTSKRFTNTRYSFYASMAEFPEIVSPTLNAILGLIHERPPKIELPKDMEYLLTSVTPDGEDLHDFWERCTREVLTTGRFVTLGEIVADKAYLCEYPAESLINWQLRSKREGGGPSLAVLHETKLVPDPGDEFDHKTVDFYRVLELVDGVYSVRLFAQAEGGAIQEVPLEDETAAFVDDPTDALVYGGLSPLLFGRAFREVPLTVVNAINIGLEYGPIPMLPMTRRALAIFRRSADYNRSLYIKGDPQCVLFGVPEEDIPSEIGGGKIWAFENPEGKAEYLDIDGQGIPLMRQSIEDEFARFADEVGMLLEDSATGYESGEALKRRQSMRQVTVKSVVINAGEGMQEALRSLGRMMGKSDAEVEKIVFEPNIDFAESMMSGQELFQFAQAAEHGAPLSQRSLHDLLRRRQVTNLTYEEEKKLIDEDQQAADERAKKKMEDQAKITAENAPPQVAPASKAPVPKGK